MKLYLPLLDNGLGMCRVEFLAAFIKSFSGQQVFIDRISDSHPGRARNKAAANFLSTDCDYLLFIDTDIIFTAAHIAQLMESDEPVLGGIYCLKCEDLKPCLVTLPGHVPVRTGRTVEVKRTGTGFLRIHRSVFEKLKSPEIHYLNHGRDEWDFFRSGVVDAEWLSEDWFFCDQCRAAGFRVMVDTRIQLGHEGSIVYPLKKEPDRLTVCPPEMKEYLDRIWDGEYDIALDPPPASVLDIGANIGAFSVWACEQWPGATVRAYEPHPDNAALFRINTRHFADAVDLTVAGVRKANGVHYLTEGGNCGEHSFHFDGETKVSAVCVGARSLPSADFVKIDTEGCEVEILEGLDLSRTRAVALEYHSEPDRATVEGILHSRGFETIHHEPIVAGRGVLKFRRHQHTTAP